MRMGLGRKSSIQLSMNFLVMLIIAIVIFILSLSFLAHFFLAASELKLKLDSQTKSQIESLLAGNARVAIPLDTKIVKPGEPAIFGVGIKNTIPDTYFKVQFLTDGKFIPAEAPDEGYDVKCFADLQQCVINGYIGQSYDGGGYAIEYKVGNAGETNVKINEESIVLIGTKTLRKAPLGHYIFTVYVCVGASSYPVCNLNNLYDDTVHKMHMIVK
ncbi:hypothetical protein H6503_04880 [Candidatus Woesearchaeota archaeon]|nr:hypothetical protein [Candidatus Woesearchaeota archaeon]